MTRPLILDAFCGVGGAGEGYRRAGFDVVGVDIVEQPHYPFTFYRHDALQVLENLARDGHALGRIFAAVHASPPCQPSSSLTGWGQSRRIAEPKLNLIPQVRALLEAIGLPYAIENVEGADLENAVRICGQGLGLKVRRHRRFESNVPMMSVPCVHDEVPYIVVRGSIGRKVFDPRRKALAPTLEQAREFMGIPWAVTAGEISDAIPPAYTEHIGAYLMAEINREALAA